MSNENQQENRQLLFIYGTLKRGHSRAASLIGQQFLGEARTLARYRLFDCGSYPGLVESDDGLEINGEVWSVDQSCLKQLDVIEAVEQGLYRRGAVELQSAYDSQVESYFYLLPVGTLADCGDLWTE